MQDGFSAKLGALIPEDIVYEILTMSGHGRWRGSKFMYSIPLDDPRREIIKKIPPLECVAFHINIHNNSEFTGVIYDYFVRLNNNYEILSAVYYGDRKKMISNTIFHANIPIHNEYIRVY
jgi:hypothetical protein